MPKLLLKNAMILTMNEENTVYENGFVCIQGSTIEAIGPAAKLAEMGNFEDYQVMDCQNRIAMPGMVNTHCHMSMMVFRSLADDVKDRLKRYLFPLEKRAMTCDMAVTGANYAMAELLLGGVTTVYDAYFFEDEIAKAAEQCGIRAMLAETVLNFPTPSAREAYGGIPYSIDFIEKWKGHSRIYPSVNCHAIYTNDTAHLQECHRIARTYDLVMSMHVAEMEYEQQDCLRDFGKTPIGYLDSIGLLDEHFLAAHAINLNQEDISLLAKRGVKVSYNAGSNAKSAKGVAPIYAMQQQGITVSLGTDGPMSGNTIDIITQLPLVGKIQKLFNHDRSLYPAKDILRMATIDGAKALGLDAITGSLEVGKQADIILFETDSINMSPLYDPFSVIVYSANPSNIDTTIVDGEVLVQNKTLLSMDLPALKSKLLGFQSTIQNIATQLSKEI